MKIKNVLTKTGNVVANTAKFAAATVVAAATAEATYLGAEMLQNDTNFVKNLIAEKRGGQQVVWGKNSRFSNKKERYVYNEKTGTYKPYNGKKMPETKKCVVIKNK